ncbi:mutagen-sensitive 304 [Choristoneura fumiferana]|uniref:mutagen-sensitive 304 n=1 Tax=Choristoneura fumiferana TaxID=7141 RepID=UPI003D15AC21
MSKRFFPQQHGERKKAKLDITISDHNFPLSQSSETKNDADNWGDDIEDEMLLQASQACEQAFHNNSTLPDFSLCMQPGATSTQMFPQPSTSKAEFHFKKPSINSPQLTSTHLKDKCTRISSPLPGMSARITQVTDTMKFNDDLIYNDKVYKGQDSDHIYRQLLQMQEENAKLKSENGKLLDKCVTKEGEASILRTQLKTCQVAVDNARLEKIKAQEKVQMEWTEKLSIVSGQMHDLRTQLDFKNLEIISIKEKCKMLESSKVKLTQVTVPSNDISSSHRHSISSTYNAPASQRRLKMTSSSAQTDSRAHFLNLNKTSFKAPSKLMPILPLILEPTSEQPSLLEHNDKLRTDRDDFPRSCRVLGAFHRLPATPSVRRQQSDCKVSIGCLQEDLTCMANGTGLEERLDKIVKATSASLTSVLCELRAVASRATTAFLRQMDERYIAAAATYLCVTRHTLLAARALYKEEQAILARRMVAILAYILDPTTRIVPEEVLKKQTARSADGLMNLINDICTLLDTASCATFYSGLLCSITHLLETLPPNPLAAGIVKTIVACRPMPFALCRLLAVLRRLAADGLTICVRSGNMRVDFEQGVLLYRKDSCHFHVLLKQVEVALKCIEKQNLVHEALTNTQNLLAFCNNYSPHINMDHDNRCDCQLVLMQVVVYALRICSVMMDECKPTDDKLRCELTAACRGGILLLHRGASRDVELAAQLGLAEGHFMEFCERLKRHPHDELYENMLLELAGTFQCVAEDTPPSYQRQAWVKSFAACSLAD